jgi:hypothetical protein
MDDAPRTALDTREFAVRWQAIVEEHFATRLAESLGQLLTAEPGGAALPPERRAAIARLIVQALHVAASPRGGVEEAVRYVVQTASDGLEKADRA